MIDPMLCQTIKPSTLLQESMGPAATMDFGDDGCESHETSPVKSQVVLQVNYGILDTIYHVKTQNNTN